MAQFTSTPSLYVHRFEIISCSTVVISTTASRFYCCKLGFPQRRLPSAPLIYSRAMIVGILADSGRR
ncbi:hypothetical protein BT96DRAFT_428099 [Gymnopus androsaceus JB14]|uniref:Uncharacterized protein n=1 Tax=Gymnopus androsaceus JB14 TaxID=1447944 RepID=A0A6A4GSM0_9AGAR|nr:hypothetical protein BT96DRAFT_428099 [Gymnopus androsaceus JB14]